MIIFNKQLHLDTEHCVSNFVSLLLADRLCLQDISATIEASFCTVGCKRSSCSRDFERRYLWSYSSHCAQIWRACSLGWRLNWTRRWSVPAAEGSCRNNVWKIHGWKRSMLLFLNSSRLRKTQTTLLSQYFGCTVLGSNFDFLDASTWWSSKNWLENVTARLDVTRLLDDIWIQPAPICKPRYMLACGVPEATLKLGMNWNYIFIWTSILFRIFVRFHFISIGSCKAKCIITLQSIQDIGCKIMYT